MKTRPSITIGCAAIVTAYLYFHGGGVHGGFVLISRALGQLSSTLLLLGLALAARAVWLWHRAKAVATWPVTSGVVTESRVDSRRQNISLTMRNNVKARFYQPLVVYTYSVAGKSFKGRQLQLAARGRTRERANAEAVVARYPPGMDVRVWYDPARPADAFLDPSPGPLWRQAVVWSAACLVLGVYGLTV